MLTGIMLIKSLVHRQPLLQLDERGLTFISIQGRGKLIPWSDIAGFGDYRIHSQQFITVIISDPEQPLKEVSAIQRRTIAISLRLTGAPYSICPSTLAYPRNKLRSTLQEYHTKFR